MIINWIQCSFSIHFQFIFRKFFYRIDPSDEGRVQGAPLDNFQSFLKNQQEIAILGQIFTVRNFDKNSLFAKFGPKYWENIKICICRGAGLGLHSDEFLQFFLIFTVSLFFHVFGREDSPSFHFGCSWLKIEKFLMENLQLKEKVKIVAIFMVFSKLSIKCIYKLSTNLFSSL